MRNLKPRLILDKDSVLIQMSVLINVWQQRLLYKNERSIQSGKAAAPVQAQAVLRLAIYSSSQKMVLKTPALPL